MSKTKRRNLHLDSLRLILFPRRLWTPPFTMAFAVCAATVFAFDIIWCLSTTFRPMSLVSTYIFGFTLALIMALPSAFTRRVWPQVLVLLAADGLCIANLIYCRTYYTPIPPASYLLAGNMGQFSDSVGASLSWADAILPLITAAGWWLMHRSASKWQRRRATLGPHHSPNRTAPYLLTLAVMTVVCWITGLCHHGGMINDIKYLKGNYSMHSTYPVAYTLPCAFIADLQSTSDTPSEAETAAAREWLASYRQAIAPAIAAAPDSLTRDNLVIILVESLEGWTLGKSIEGQEITPNLNRWLADSATWMMPRFRSQVGAGRSIDGHLITLTGLLPTTDMVYAMKYDTNDYPSLVKEMKRANGATSYIFSGARPVMWNQKRVAQAFGFEHTFYRDSWDASEHFGKNTSPSDKSFISQVITMLRNGEVWPEGEKAVVEVATMSSHFPFIIPEDKRTISLKDSYPRYFAEYVTSVNYADGAIGELLDYLRSRADWPRTMVAIMGDHEALASYRKNMRSNSEVAASLIDPDSNVPLILLNAPRPGHADRQMDQVDIYPTILDMLGIKPLWNGTGVSALADSVTLPPAVTEKRAAASATMIKGDMLKGTYGATDRK